MPRRRLAAVLLVPSPWAAELDGLRRACGDHMLERVPPHITLVSPVNVAEGDVGAALKALRRGAAAVRGPVEVEIGPAATFAPDSPVLYLSVSPTADLDDVLTAVQHGALARPPRWSWVPHVTIAQDQTEQRLLAGVEALSEYRIATSIDRLHLMEERPDATGRRVWVPIADVVLGPTVVVGRGTFPLELTTGAIVDPECLALASDLAIPVPADLDLRTVVVAARRADTGELVGVAISAPHPTGMGEASGEVTWQALMPEAEQEGAGDHLAARLRWAATG